MTDVASQQGGGADALPSSAFPPGVDPAAYVAQHTNVNTAPPLIADPAAAQVAQRPDNIPEKFWDAEKGTIRTDALLQSYGELEKRLGKPAEPAQQSEEPAAQQDPNKATIERPQETQKETQQPDGQQPAEDPKVQEVADAVRSVAEKYATSGNLEDTDFAALEKVGLPRQFVENYMRGIRALEQVTLQEAHNAAGGKDTFEAAKTWAAKELSDADLAFYNDNVNDPAKARSAVEWLVSKYKAAVPNEGKLLNATAPSNLGGDVYRSTQQLSADMSSPQYKTDPAFRQSVADKLARSRLAGTLQSNVEYFG